jgi:hypothetical protein
MMVAKWNRIGCVEPMLGQEQGVLLVGFEPSLKEHIFFGPRQGHVGPMWDLCSVHVGYSSGHPYLNTPFLRSCCGHVGAMSGPIVNVRLGTHAGPQMNTPFLGPCWGYVGPYIECSSGYLCRYPDEPALLGPMLGPVSDLRWALLNDAK